jgi:ATP-binding cassette subfamily E protein 1
MNGLATGPFEMKEGMNQFLGLLGVTFRRDKTGRPRINKPGSYLDREQKETGEYYYYDLDAITTSGATKEGTERGNVR